MKPTASIIGAALILSLWGCSVMPRQIEDEALPTDDFTEWVRGGDRYVGETVITGGYVLSVENRPDHTRVLALEAPLGMGQRPVSKDRSRGRLILLHDGFLDPEVYTRERQITVGGVILDPSVTGPQTFPYLALKVREIHLWPVETPATEDPFLYDPWWFYPWWPHPCFWGYHPWHHRHWCD
jgi:outer membrane lipoprotein